MTQPIAPVPAAEELIPNPDRECGEHRPTIGRSWCFEDKEWCYPDIPCRGCELPTLRAELERLREHVTILEGAVDGCRISCAQWERVAQAEMLRHGVAQSEVARLELEIAQLKSGQPWEELFRQRDEAIAERDRLRDQITEAEAVIVRAQDALGVDHPVWVILDDYDGSMDSVHALVRERDEARAQRDDALDRMVIAHQQRDDARDERDRYAEVVEAARQWREMRRGTPAKPKPESAALIAAVDRLTPGDETP